MLGVTATVKVFIDVFIGVWAFILAYIWTNHINPTPGDKARFERDLGAFPQIHSRLRRDLRHRLVLALTQPAAGVAKLTAAIGEANAFRVIFFVLTFFSIGVMSNFRVLWREGLPSSRRSMWCRCSAS